MSSIKLKLGYCPHCMKNLAHAGTQDGLLYHLGNVLALGTFRFWRVGSWNCTLCNRQSLRLMGCRRHVPTLREPGGQSTIEPTDSNLQATESVGNFIKQEVSLVARRERANRFSVKFRDNVVRRLISTDCSMSDLCNDLQISESDIVDWLADHISRQQERCERLENDLKQLEATENSLDLQRRLSHHEEEQQSFVAQSHQISPDDTVRIVDGKVLSS